MSAGRGRQKHCIVCRTERAAFSTVEYCFACWPGGPFPPLPCLRCGSRIQYFVNGLCHRCHIDGHPGVASCANCLAWGASTPAAGCELERFLARRGHRHPGFAAGNIIDDVSFTARWLRNLIAGIESRQPRTAGGRD